MKLSKGDLVKDDSAKRSVSLCFTQTNMLGAKILVIKK